MTPTELFLLGFSSALGLAGVGAATWMHGQLRRLRIRHQQLGTDVADLARELELLADISDRRSGHLSRVERNQAEMDERLGALELRGESRPYDQAIDSARHGADPSRLARQFGLSPTEASLVTLLHGSKRRA